MNVGVLRKTSWLLLAALGLAGCVGGPRPADRGILLAENGRALVPIVISEAAMTTTNKYQWGLVTPVDGLRQVAEDLAANLERMTGAQFTVTTGDCSRGIVLGTLDEFPELQQRGDLRRALRLRDGYDGIEALAIRTEPDRLLLVGNTILGASHAASRLLEELGCRWFFPGDAWRVTPSVPTLRVNLTVDDRPKIPTFVACYGYNWFDDQCLNDYRAWQAHNLVGSSIPTHTGHNWPQIIAHFQKEFDAHPEYFALRIAKDEQTGAVLKQERDVKSGRLCVSNPAVIELCRRYALDWFAKHPDAVMVSLCPGDYSGGSILGGHCQCDQCAKIGNGSVSDQAFYLANQVAKTVAEKCPGKMIGMLAYEYTADVPSFPLEPNVFVELASIFIRGRHSYEQLVELWPQKTKNIGFYDYYSVFHWDRGMLPGTPRSGVSAIRQQIPMLAAHGAKSFNPEISCCWGPYGLSFYTAVRLRWDPAQNVDALLQDFYDQAFGPAAPAMKRYYERLDPGRALMGDHLMAQAVRDVDEATRLAAGRPDVLARLDQLKTYLHYFRLQWEMNQTTDKARKKELLGQLFTLSGRSRRTYMVDWAWIRFWWMDQASNEYAEPAWKWKGVEDQRADPFTAAEIDAMFRDDLAYFQPQAVEEKTFSEDLVPVQFVPSDTRVQGNQASFQGAARYALYSLAGEPLEFAITTGTIPYYRDKNPAYYKVTDAAGKKIADGNLPLDGEDHPLKVPVPARGRYYLDLEDDSGWRISAAPNCPLTLLGQKRSARGGWCWYFYVPKGTRQVQYYASGQTPPYTVRMPGKDIEVNEIDRIITLPVPAGADGQVWCFLHQQVITLRFFNIPSYIAAAPNALMVPREVAAADALAVRAGAAR